jgi:dTDP-glucose 4,6-dehydratase
MPSSEKKTVCVTGCLGFMGSHFTRIALKKGWRVWGIDKKTYAARPEYLKEFSKYKTFAFLQADIAEIDHLYEVDYVVNFAAETHVDNSIVDSKRFLRSNIMGVQNLLELIRAKRHYEMPLLLQISTDEVYGDITEGRHKVTDALHPSNPYSSSKAAADLLILGWHRTHEVPYLIVRPTNNYGLGQYPEKLIPKSVKYLNLGKKIPLHGDGSYIRNWLHVEDTCRGLFLLLDKGKSNRIYHIGGNYETSNKDVVAQVLKSYFRKRVALQDFVKFNYVRMGEDVRYSLDDSAIRALGWNNQRRLDREMNSMVAHYRKGYIW